MSYERLNMDGSQILWQIINSYWCFPITKMSVIPSSLSLSRAGAREGKTSSVSWAVAVTRDWRQKLEPGKHLYDFCDNTSNHKSIGVLCFLNVCPIGILTHNTSITAPLHLLAQFNVTPNTSLSMDQLPAADQQSYCRASYVSNLSVTPPSWKQARIYLTKKNVFCDIKLIVSDSFELINWKL